LNVIFKLERDFGRFPPRVLSQSNRTSCALLARCSSENGFDRRFAGLEKILSAPDCVFPKQILWAFETGISVVDLLVAEFSPKPIATPASPAVTHMTARRIEVSLPVRIRRHANQ
jgi:hypothetical protein